MAQDILPTQEIIEVATIENDALVLKTGGLRKILLVSGINFELKSEEEQDLILLTYQELLHSLNFPLQQLIHTRRLNIENYLLSLTDRQLREDSPLLKKLIGDYRDFIQSFVQNNPIMSKKFFVVIPYERGVDLAGAGRAVRRGIWGIFRRPSGRLEPIETPQSEDFAKLNQRAEQVANGLGLIGLRAVPLNKDELVELLYNFYNAR